MARLPRLTVAGQVHRLVLRGNNGQPLFIDDEDRSRLLQLLRDHAVENAVSVHAHALVTSQVLLLATPADARLPAWMQAVGRRYVRYFNDRHGRTGTLFEGRYRCTVLHSGHWLLPAMVANDLAPVAAGLVAEPDAWPWSSHGRVSAAPSAAWPHRSRTIRSGVKSNTEPMEEDQSSQRHSSLFQSR